MNDQKYWIDQIKSEMNIEKQGEHKGEIPINGLPEDLQNQIKERAEIYGVPQDFFTASILSAAASILGTKVTLKGKYDNTARLWFIFVAPSGTGKTEPAMQAYRPIIEEDDRLYDEWKEDYNKWKAAQQIAKMSGADFDEREPRLEQRVLNDATPEGLLKSLEGNPNGVTIVRDEILGFLTDNSRYNQNGFIQQLLSSWSGVPIQINRKSEQPVRIPDPFINLIGGVQPGVFSGLAKGGNDTNGFLQRCCFVFPDERIRAPYQRKEIDSQREIDYRRVLGRLRDIPSGTEYRLSLEAEDSYAEYYNSLSLQILDEKSDYQKEALAKANIIALRVALVVHCLHNSTQSEIPQSILEYGISVSKYFSETQKRIGKLLSERNTVTRNIKPTREELIGLVHDEFEIKNKQQFAESLGIKREYVSRAVKKKSVLRVTCYAGDNPLINNDYSEDSTVTQGVENVKSDIV